MALDGVESMPTLYRKLVICNSGEPVANARVVLGIGLRPVRLSGERGRQHTLRRFLAKLLYNRTRQVAEFHIVPTSANPNEPGW